MKKRTLGSEYVSSFCLEMALLLHAGISTEDGLYLLSEDETNPDIIRRPAKRALRTQDNRGGNFAWQKKI